MDLATFVYIRIQCVCKFCLKFIQDAGDAGLDQVKTVFKKGLDQVQAMFWQSFTGKQEILSRSSEAILTWIKRDFLTHGLRTTVTVPLTQTTHSN